METHYAFSSLQIDQNSAVPESGLIIQNKDLRLLKSLNYSTFGNPSNMSGAVKREVIDQVKYTYLSVQTLLGKCIVIQQNEYLLVKCFNGAVFFSPST